MVPERPIVTFDLDGVLCRPPFGINPGSGRHKRRDKRGKWSVLWLTEPGRYMLRRPMPGAVEGFREFSERFDCRVLSARAGHSLGFTQGWFRKHFGPVPALYLRPTWEETPAQFKVRMVQELGAVAHFEDDPFTAQWVAELLPAVFLVDWGRNRWLEGDRIHRIQRIEEAAGLLDQIAPAE